MDLLNLMDQHVIYYSDLSLPIYRFGFAQKAASLVAVEFGSNMESYLLIMNYRGQAESKQLLVKLIFEKFLLY